MNWVRCPFCNSGILRLRNAAPEQVKACFAVAVHCYTCGADGPGATDAISAVEKWNVRPVIGEPIMKRI